MSNYKARRFGFTLIELLTVMAIIAILVALIFPTAATVREQARSSDCLSKLHQIWVSASVYKADEGSFPETLYGYAEYQDKDVNGNCSSAVSSGVPYGTDSSLPCAGKPPVNFDRVVNGFLYPEQVKDANLFKCPDNTHVDKSEITKAYYPPKPARWDTDIETAGRPWIGDTLGAYGCSDSVGVYDCYVGGPNDKAPKFHYVMNSYDIGPAVDDTGARVTSGGKPIYLKHFSPDWTGITGITDYVAQLKYAAPPTERTIMTFCSWHAWTAGRPGTPAVNLAGTAKVLNLAEMVRKGPNVYAGR